MGFGFNIKSNTKAIKIFICLLLNVCNGARQLTCYNYLKSVGKQSVNQYGPCFRPFKATSFFVNIIKGDLLKRSASPARLDSQLWQQFKHREGKDTQSFIKVLIFVFLYKLSQRQTGKYSICIIQQEKKDRFSNLLLLIVGRSGSLKWICMDICLDGQLS